MSMLGQLSNSGADFGTSANAGIRPGPGGQGNTSAAEGAVRTFAVMMAEEMLLGTTHSQSQAIAKKLPGASENVNGRMQTLREEEQLAADRREIGKKMSEKDNAMNFRD